MTKGKVIAISTLSVLLIGIVAHHLYGWFATGQLYLSSRSHPGRYVTFASDPIGFILGFGYDAFAVLLALILLATMLAAE